MFRISVITGHKTGILSVFLMLISSLTAFGQIDKSKYITVDEIKPGMEAYCLTVYRGVEIEKFEMEVLSVVYDWRPGKNSILVIGKDERFLHTGAVAGCSGSPVYIDGRMAGALAWGYHGAKDPLYFVTPIEEMLRIGKYEPPEDYTSMNQTVLDYSKPIDLPQIYEKFFSPESISASLPAGAKILPCPLSISLPSLGTDKLKTDLEPLGLVPMPGTGRTKFNEYKDIDFAPGSIIAVPLSTGDIDMSAIGTVTEVVGDKVYAFGHGFLGLSKSFKGQGPINLPMATGYVHTVVAHDEDSFKYGQAIDIKGALRADEATGIFGQIGATAPMIPMTITIDRFNDEKIRTYNCQVAIERFYTPTIVRLALVGTSMMLGELPPDHMIEYKANIGVKDMPPISFENISTGMGLNNLVAEAVGSVALLMNNPYQKMEITSLDFNVKIVPKNIISRIWSVDVSDTTVKPGQTLDVSVILESYLSSKKHYNQQIKVPDQLEPGRYKLVVTGSNGYRKFLQSAFPFRFVPENARDMIDIINDITNMPRNRLYTMLILPKSGIALERAALPDLPQSKALLLTDNKRTLKARPVTKWLEENISIEGVVADQKTVEITVEE